MVHPLALLASKRVQIADLSAYLDKFALGEPAGNGWIGLRLAHDDDVVRFKVIPGDIRGTFGEDILFPGCQKLRKLEHSVRRTEIHVVAIFVQLRRVEELLDPHQGW